MSDAAHQTDVLIVGGGPAGLAAAIAAAAKGFLVTVADPAVPPIDKACGEGLMPDAVAALDKLGVKIVPDEAIPFRGIRFCAAGRADVVEAEFAGVVGLGVRRTVLHSRLVRRASELGVRLLWGSRVTSYDGQEALCQGQKIGCRWLVGADGENSQVRRWMTGRRPCYERVRFGYRQHFRAMPWTDLVEVHWTPSAQIVAAPVGPEEVCLAITSRHPQLRPQEALQEAPQLAALLAGAPQVTMGRGARTALRRLHAVHRENVALIGDASGSVDPITGEGLGLAFQQAAALGESLAAGDLRLYQSAHERIARIPRLTSRFVLAMDAHPSFRYRALRALAADPAVFARLLNTQVRSPHTRAFGVGDAFRLGWRVLSLARSGAQA